MLNSLAKSGYPPRPVMRYHGGKFLLARWIVSHFPAHRVYTEAYGGAASVLLHKARTYAEVYNDLDGEVCNVFRVLRDPSQSRELKRVLEYTPFARLEFEEAYQAAADPIEQARRTIARSFMGFGSTSAMGRATGFRNNANRSGTTPSHDWVNYVDALDFFVERLRGVVIENRPALKVVTQFDKSETLHYIDPPYVQSSRAGTADYYRFEMSDDEHRAMATTLRGAEGMIVLSGYHNILYDELFADWFQVEREARADGQRLRTEVLWLNASAHERLEAQRAQGGLFSTQATATASALS